MDAQKKLIDRPSGRRRRAFGGRSVSAEVQGQGQSPELCEWFRPRTYAHFDRPVSTPFAVRVLDPTFVEAHAFSPLIHTTRREKRYKFCEEAGRRVMSVKERPIKYASHRDACIYSLYAHRLGEMLEAFYEANDLIENVVAYRALGKANYDFAAVAQAFLSERRPATVLAFDVTSFFDTLDHRLLKQRLKRLLGVASLPADWHKVLKNVTRYHSVDRERLKEHPVFSRRMSGPDPIATLRELKAAGIDILANPTVGKGVPQGTPISAALSNLYMIDFDRAAKAYCNRIGALYMRYSDDILIICRPEHTVAAQGEILRLIGDEHLEIQKHKTEVTLFEEGQGGKSAQYLGFMLAPDASSIRASSIGRQYRKMRQAMRRTRRIAEAKMAAGEADRAFTKKLRRRFTSLPFRNFCSYARRSEGAFDGSKKIRRQRLRFERAVEHALKDLEKLHPLARPAQG